MANIKKVFILILLVMISGCSTEYTEIDTTKLNSAFIMNSSPTFEGYFYLGSDQSYHYFISKWKYATDRKFKIRKDALKTSIEKPLEDYEVDLFVLKPKNFEAEVFCSINDEKVYYKPLK